MFMSWKSIYSDMVFTTDKDEHARKRTVRDAVRALYDYMDGNAAPYDVREALAELEGEFGADIIKYCAPVRECLSWDDGEARGQVIAPQINNIENFLRRRGKGHYL